MMQLRFFLIPVRAGEEAAGELNRFLAGNRILAIDRQLVQDGANSGWTVCVTYEEGPGRTSPGRRGKVDFREVLSEPEFAVFARLRALRKELAEAEGVPPYALFTNEQLAEMVQRRVSTPSALREIPGVGEGRVEKYADAFLRLLTEAALPVVQAAAPAGDEA
jgi:superfamily II DNA helicase RecQ